MGTMTKVGWWAVMAVIAAAAVLCFLSFISRTIPTWVAPPAAVIACALSIGVNDSRRIVGWGRLRHGFCPKCNSSPPKSACPVCFGHQRYGNQLTPVVKAQWKERWEMIS